MKTARSLMAAALCLLSMGALACGPTAADGIPSRIQTSLDATAQEWYETGQRGNAQSIADFDFAGGDDQTYNTADSHRTGCELAARQVAEEAAVYYRAGKITRLESNLAIEAAMSRIGCAE